MRYQAVSQMNISHALLNVSHAGKCVKWVAQILLTFAIDMTVMFQSREVSMLMNIQDTLLLCLQLSAALRTSLAVSVEDKHKNTVYALYRFGYVVY